MRACRLALLALLVFLGLSLPAAAAAAPGVTLREGTLGGAAYRIEVPANWNGTLVLYSHGYVVPGDPNPALDAGDPLTAAWLLQQGYALAGSAYRSTGWAVQDALQDQVALLDYFDSQFGTPARTIAWGHSLGGMITAGLVQRYPDRFAGALPMCGVLAGGVGVWNSVLDASFAFKTLLAPASGLQVVRITDPLGNLTLAEQTLAAAQGTPQGRARLALAAALGDLPGWFDSFSAEPARADLAARQQNQFLWQQQVEFPFAFALRAELEGRAGGNPSWNTDSDYRELLARSSDADEVRALYREAGLSLEDDLRTLDDAPRVAADPGAVAYLTQNIVYDGQIRAPVLTMHTTGDGLVVVQNEQAYASAVRAAGNQPLLRQVYVHRAGHCAFTPAETIAAFQTLIGRLDTGRWAASDNPTTLNGEAAALGPAFNVFASGSEVRPTPPAFVRFHPSAFPRPFDTRAHGHGRSAALWSPAYPGGQPAAPGRQPLAAASRRGA
ncbi:MAG TPA: prolyl oligopeptidase family serine peptidase [Thermomicrobiales bacterium]|nr:prolyl oligopeptidase family serine peptidase [Thermomicrobiales bacterium]